MSFFYFLCLVWFIFLYFLWVFQKRGALLLLSMPMQCYSALIMCKMHSFIFFIYIQFKSLNIYFFLLYYFDFFIYLTESVAGWEKYNLRSLSHLRKCRSENSGNASDRLERVGVFIQDRITINCSWCETGATENGLGVCVSMSRCNSFSFYPQKVNKQNENGSDWDLQFDSPLHAHNVMMIFIFSPLWHDMIYDMKKMFHY